MLQRLPTPCFSPFVFCFPPTAWVTNSQQLEDQRWHTPPNLTCRNRRPTEVPGLSDVAGRTDSMTQTKILPDMNTWEPYWFGPRECPSHSFCWMRTPRGGSNCVRWTAPGRDAISNAGTALGISTHVQHVSFATAHQIYHLAHVFLRYFYDSFLIRLQLSTWPVFCDHLSSPTVQFVGPFYVSCSSSIPSSPQNLIPKRCG